MKAKITLNNVRAFLTGHSRKFWNKYLSDIIDFPEHIQEQVQYRISLIEKNSPECLIKNACQKCGHECSVDALVYDNESCAGKCYPPMLNAEDWNKLKNNGL